MLLAIYGVIHSGWWSQVIWVTPFNREGFVYLCLLCFAAYFLALKLKAWSLPLLLFPLAFFIGITGFAPVVAVVWFWACAFLVGAGITFSVTDNQFRIFTLSNAAVGFAAMGTIVGLLAHLPINVPVMYLGLFSTLAALGAFRCLRGGRFRVPVWPTFTFVKRPVSECIMGALALLGATLVLVVTMAPAMGYDALAYHLTIPAKMLELGFWRFDVTLYIWSVMPFGGDWLFVPPYFLGGESAARLVNSSFLLATAYAAYQLLLPRLGRAMALSAPALLLTWPISLLEVGSTFVEAPLAFFFMMSLNELVGTNRQKGGRWMVLGIIAGYGCSIKLLGALILPFLLAGAILRSLQGRFERMRVPALCLGVLCFLIVCIPPYLVAFLKTGNPLFPFFNSIFRSPYFMVGSVFQNGSDFANPFYVRPLQFRTFWDMTINSMPYGEFQATGVLGIALIVLVPLSALAAIFARRWWVLACIASVFAYGILVFHNQAYLRYIFPALPWLFVAAAFALSQLPRPAWTATGLVALLCLVSLARFPVGHWAFAQFDAKLLWDRSIGERMLLRNKPEVVVGEIMSKLAEYRGKRILLLGVDPIYSAYPDGTIADAWHSWSFFQSKLGDKTILTSVARSGAEVIVYSVGRGFAGEAELAKNSTEEFRVGDVRIARLNPDVRFAHSLFARERVLDPDVGAQHGGRWQLNGAEVVADGISARLDTAIAQAVDFKPPAVATEPNKIKFFAKPLLPVAPVLEPVLLEMSVSCPEGQTFRSQVNWHDVTGKFLAADLEVHACQKEQTEVRRILYKPQDAVSGIVYGSSHDQRPVIIKKISLRTAT